MKLKILKGGKSDGGLRLTDLKKRDQALKIQWVYRLHGNDRVLTKLAYYHMNTALCNELFWQCNFKVADKGYVCSAVGFWGSVVSAWTEYNFHTPKTPI